MLHIVGSREQSSNVEKDSVLAGFRMNSCRTYVRRYYRIYKETVDRLRISISSYRMRNSISETHFDGTNITDFLDSPHLGPLYPRLPLSDFLISR
jgi:hypothetical protein